jgi:hypothetical protein
MSKYKYTEGNPPKDFYKPVQFHGNYTATGGNYYQHSTTSELIKVCERKQPTANKPRLYLVSKTIDGRYPFLSSLYPQPNGNTLTAEINRVYFNVELTEEQITITRK